MSVRLFFVACLICGCNRAEPPSGVPTPVHLATGLSSPSTPAVSRRQIDADALRSVTSGSSSAGSAVRRGKTLSAVAVGYTSGLRLEPDALTYCDDRGGRALDLGSGVDSARERSCDKHEERNSGCGQIDFVESVREPGPDDIIDAKEGRSFPVNGHIHDCAFNSGVLLVATGLEIVAIDVKAHRSEQKSKDGGDQVAINDAWIAWSDGEKVFAEHR